MKSVIRGNFKTKNKIEIKDEQEESLEDRFEKEALAKLGGSIAFVSRKKVLWPDEGNGSEAKDES